MLSSDKSWDLVEKGDKGIVWSISEFVDNRISVERKGRGVVSRKFQGDTGLSRRHKNN